jgi:hypothetical protein
MLENVNMSDAPTLSEKSFLILPSAYNDDKVISSRAATRTAVNTNRHGARFVKLALSGVVLLSLICVTFDVMTRVDSNEERAFYGIVRVDPDTGYPPDIPLLGKNKKWKRHRAQTIADDYRESFLDAIKSDSAADIHPFEKKAKVQNGCEASVVIVRHCEKASIREHCSYIGYERAVFLATLFGNKKERWPTPSYLYAENPSWRNNPKKNNFREIETLLPLADKVKVTIDSTFSTISTSGLAKELLGKLSSGEMCGKVAVVSWKHTGIAALANKLGCGPNQGCPFDYPGASFDQAWTIRFVYEKIWHSEHKSGKIPRKARWQVFGSVQAENFDPLHFSKEFGDYPKGGTSHGGRWRGQWADKKETEDVTEENAELPTRLVPPRNLDCISFRERYANYILNRSID